MKGRMSTIAQEPHPITHQVLVSLLKDYKRPNDKIHELLKSGALVSLKKGLYLWGTAQQAESFAIANVLYGPSYVSATSALAYHQLIPEQVYATVSMTTKLTREYSNAVGYFEYRKLPWPYYTFGIRYEHLGGAQFAMVASREKALFDQIVTTAGVVLRSTAAALVYLADDLRIDEDQLRDFDLHAMETWLGDAPKRESLTHITKAIAKL
jgi:predicted transcriptional regulator of viral defense system